MKQVVLGRTGLKVNKLGFGGIPIQRVSEEEAVETIRHAVQNGIDFIDTSRIYPTSEHKIGIALQQTERKVVLATKSKERTASKIRSDIDISLKELQTDYIHIYQCHFVKKDDYPAIISSGGALEGLLQAKEEGLIGHLGVSSHSLDMLDRVIEDGLFDTIMVCFSFMEPEAENKIIPKAIEKNIGVIAMKPMSGGVIEHPKPALKFSLAQEGVLVLCGVENIKKFDENWEIFTGDYDLDDEDKKIIENMRKGYDKNFCRRCDYCQPCTEGIPIQMILGVRSQAKRMGEHIFTNEPRKSMIEKARNCSECGECMTRCPYELPIPELLKERIQWVDSLLKSMQA